MLKLRHISLCAIILLAIWALRPPEKETDSEDKTDAGPKQDRKYKLRIDAGTLYRPGTMPFDVDKPLEGLDLVARDFEELHPDTEIEYVVVPRRREWLVTQLVAEAAPDILNVNVEDVWPDVHKGWYVALDEFLDKPNPYVESGAPGSDEWWNSFKYQAITRGKAGPDGKMYCISFDMVETGIYYNKTMFAELGIQPPANWTEFLEIQKIIQGRNPKTTPLLLHLNQINDWGVDLMFDQLYYELLPGIDLMKDPKREGYLQGYLDWDEICCLYRKGLFSKNDPRYRDIWPILKEWRPYMNNDLMISEQDKFRQFITEKAAMMWMSSSIVYKLVNDPSLKFDWGVFYPPPLTKEQSRYASGLPMCVIGGSGNQYLVSNSSFNDTGDQKTSEKLKRCISFLQFLTTPKNTDRVVNEVICFLPNVAGVEPREELRAFDEFLQRRYTTTKWNATFDLRFNEICRRSLALYIDGGSPLEEHLDWMEKDMTSAVESMLRRKDLDLTPYNERWDELAPMRADVKGLPDATQ